MNLDEYLASFGFSANPFSSTNAGDEPHLTEYFVPPPYFPAVLGTPQAPRSDIVLAPRGGGKTAQRIMLEVEAATNGSFLCITYDNFGADDDAKSSNATLSYHLSNVIRLLLVAVLSEISFDESNEGKLAENDKAIIKYQVTAFLGNFTAADYEEAVKALKNFREKAEELWQKYGGKIAAVINAFIEKYGFGSIDLSGVAEVDKNKGESVRYHFQRLVEIAQKLDLTPIYILVDRVDELNITSRDAKSTFEFISPLLTDLPTLETDNAGFKIFLWDQVDEYYRDSGIRPDRIQVHHLKWTNDELRRMLEERLKAYSNGAITTLNQLIDESAGIDAHGLAARLANGSPRDMIRACRQIVAEETRAAQPGNKISKQSVLTGVKNFSDERAGELFGPYLSDLRRIGSLTYTINRLASEVFRVSQQAVRAKIQKWQSSGAAIKSGEVPNPGNRPLHLYSIADPRLAIALRPSQETELILGNCILICPSCDGLCVSDRETISCNQCFDEFHLSKAKSVLEHEGAG